MGWRTQNAYEEEEREEWRRFLASQSPWRRAYIRFIRLTAFALLLAGLVVLPILLLVMDF